MATWREAAFRARLLRGLPPQKQVEVLAEHTELLCKQTIELREQVGELLREREQWQSEFQQLEEVIPGIRVAGAVALIKKIVCEEYKVSHVDLISHRRAAVLVRPRMVAMWLARHLTLRSFPEIGRLFGKRDHTTVMHAVRKIELLLLTDTELASMTTALRGRIQAQIAQIAHRETSCLSGENGPMKEFHS